MDVHVNGELVESVSEVGPDTAVDEAPPTSAEDVPDTGEPIRGQLILSPSLQGA